MLLFVLAGVRLLPNALELLQGDVMFGSLFSSLSLDRRKKPIVFRFFIGWVSLVLTTWPFAGVLFIMESVGEKYHSVVEITGG